MQHQYTVSPETVRMLALGHPLVIADSYTSKWPAGKPGDIVELTDQTGRFLATALLSPADRIIARVLSFKHIRFDKDWLVKRIAAAVQLRRDHADLSGSSAYRLVNGEGDGLPGLTVDRYGDYLMVQLYCGGWRPHLKLITLALETLTPLGIYQKDRPQQTRELEAASDSKRYGRLLSGVSAPQPLQVQENGLNFFVHLEQGLNTGLFLDQRQNRRDVMTRVSGKKVLNLFAYTAAFSVAAAAAGASLVTSVDASATYMEWGKTNFGANRLNPKRHEFIIGDCFEVLQDMRRQRKCYDIIIMDPPSFSTTSKNRFTTRGGTSDLVASALGILADGGLLITSSNHQKVDVADYLKELRRGALQAEADLQVISLLGQPPDFPYPVTFPEGRYLKYAVSVKRQQ